MGLQSIRDCKGFLLRVSPETPNPKLQAPSSKLAHDGFYDCSEQLAGCHWLGTFIGVESPLLCLVNGSLRFRV